GGTGKWSAVGLVEAEARDELCDGNGEHAIYLSLVDRLGNRKHGNDDDHPALRIGLAKNGPGQGTATRSDNQNVERDRARQRSIGVREREEPSERDRGVGRQRGYDKKRIARHSASISGPKREKRVQPVPAHHHYRENPEKEELQIAAKQVEEGKVEQQPENVGILHSSQKTTKREYSPPGAQPSEPRTQQKHRGKCERNDSNEEHRHIESIDESASPRHAELRQPGAQAELQRIISR